jgi:hypothetical protein
VIRDPLAATVALVLALGLVAGARADVMTPPGLLPGQQFRIVFVTATTTLPISADLTGHYDPIVQGDAAAAGLGQYAGQPLTWEAIGSTSTVNAISRLPADGVPIFLPSGTEVAPSGAALWNTSNVPLLHPINTTASGGPPPNPLGTFTAWTGTTAGGLSAGTHALGPSSGFAIEGLFTVTLSSWVSFDTRGDA